MSEMPAATAEADVRTRPITVAEYHRMGDAGIIGPDERVELLDGELVAMPPTAARGDSVAPLAFPHDALPIDEILPPPLT